MARSARERAGATTTARRPQDRQCTAEERHPRSLQNMDPAGPRLGRHALDRVGSAGAHTHADARTLSRTESLRIAPNRTKTTSNHCTSGETGYLQDSELSSAVSTRSAGFRVIATRFAGFRVIFGRSNCRGGAAAGIKPVGALPGSECDSVHVTQDNLVCLL